jgi:succinate dehydrogenase / fumarate reductase cytochrome b subunit
MLAYLLNRLTALGLVVYLYLHLAVLSLLAGGPPAWDPFIALARSPAFLVLDVVLIAGWLVHGLNGIRLTLTGLGLAVRWHKPLFVGLMLVAALGLVAMTVGIFGG